MELNIKQAMHSNWIPSEIQQNPNTLLLLLLPVLLLTITSEIQQNPNTLLLLVFPLLLLIHYYYKMNPAKQAKRDECRSGNVVCEQIQTMLEAISC